MKIIKILLAVIVLGGIGYFVWQSVANPGEKSPPPVISSPFVDKIREEIDSLSKLTSSDFNGELYRNIQYRIDEWGKRKQFGETEFESDQQQDNLSRDLYAVYVSGFIVKAFVVFRSDEWDSSDRRYLATESNELKKSPYLDVNSKVREKLEEIQAILQQYNRVQNFVDNMNSYLDTSPFNFDTSKNWLAQVKDLKNRALGNKYVYNCKKFNVALNTAPARAYSKHLNSVRSQIFAKSGTYRNGTYSGQNWAQKTADYRDKVYEPVVEEMSFLQSNSDDLYGLSAYDDLQSLNNRWNRELQDAIEYFQNLSYSNNQ